MAFIFKAQTQKHDRQSSFKSQKLKTENQLESLRADFREKTYRSNASYPATQKTGSYERANHNCR